MFPVLLAAAALRIVSLAPALTEDLFAIGAGPAVVGVDAYSDRPTAARKLPRVGGLRDVDAEAVLALHPDLVVGIPYEATHLADLRRSGANTAMLRIDSLDDDLATLATLGRLTRHEAAARGVVTALRTRLDATTHAAARTHRLTAYVALGELWTAGSGSYIDDLLRRANLANVAGAVHAPWVAYSAERLLAAQPDVVIVPANAPALVGEPWDRLDAVRAGRVLRVPDDDLLRAGPRVADVLDALVAGVARWR
ncbi:MAG TPA: helical backbone metal receptor [Candidatus Limnocylindria bacterium]|nr:helical backbone metal receptor [Candidatus Limnocylindria bacterium]